MLVALRAFRADGTWATTATLVGLAGALSLDFLLTRRAWQASPPRLTRVLPAAFAIGVRRDVHLHIETAGSRVALVLIDGTDPSRRGDGHAGGARTGRVATRRDRATR